MGTLARNGIMGETIQSERKVFLSKYSKCCTDSLY